MTNVLYSKFSDAIWLCVKNIYFGYSLFYSMCTYSVLTQDNTRWNKVTT